MVVTDDHTQTAGTSADLDNTQNSGSHGTYQQVRRLGLDFSHESFLSCNVFEGKYFHRNIFECRTQNRFGGNIY